MGTNEEQMGGFVSNLVVDEWEGASEERELLPPLGIG